MSSRLLLLGRNSVKSLVPATLLSQVESLLDSHRIQHAADLADQERRRQLYGGVAVDEIETEQLHYIYQRIGFQCFKETLFEDAGKHLFEGELDPRVLISYFPAIRGSLGGGENDTIDMFTGVAEHMPTESSVEQLIVVNIVRNYSPHLAPNTREAPSTAELKKILLIAAEDMLEAFLRNCRTRWVLDEQGGQKKASPEEQAVVDSVLVKLFARSEKTQDLYALIHEPHQIVLSEVDHVLIEQGQYNALCILLKQAGEEEKLLEAWSKLVDGDWTDDDIPDPLGDMITYLTGLNERPDKSPTHVQVMQKWALWLMNENRDPERGFQLLISSRSTLSTRTSGKRPTRHKNTKSIPNPDSNDLDLDRQDQDLLSLIKEANPTAAVQYLEYLILQRGNKTREIHLEYASTCIDEVLGYLKEEGVERLWKAKAASYLSSSSFSSIPSNPSNAAPPPFISYFVSTTPDSHTKRARLKTLLFLQLSGLYDPAIIKERIINALPTVPETTKSNKPVKPILSLELAILESKLGNHRAVLESLVRDVGDCVSAEAYCTGNGNDGREVIPVRLRRLIAESTDGFSAWRDAATSTIKSSTIVETEMKLANAVLLKMLLEVYMSMDKGKGTELDAKPSQIQSQQQIQVARLLNSQGVHLDVGDVIQALPPSWPLHLLSSFLARSCQRTLHRTHEGQIVRMVALANNLAVQERTWAVLREEGFVVEEGVEGNDRVVDEESKVDVVLDEKVGLSSDSLPMEMEEPVDVLPDLDPKNE